MTSSFQHNRTRSQSRLPVSSNLLHDILSFKQGSRSKSFNKGQDTIKPMTTDNKSRTKFFTARSNRDSFFNDSIIVPIQRIDNNNSNTNNDFPQKSNRLTIENTEKEEDGDGDVLTNYNRVVKYNYQHTEYPPSHPRKQYIEKQQLSEPFQNRSLRRSDYDHKIYLDNNTNYQNNQHQNYDIQPYDKRSYSDFNRRWDANSHHNPSYINYYDDEFIKKNHNNRYSDSNFNHGNLYNHHDAYLQNKNNDGKNYQNHYNNKHNSQSMHFKNHANFKADDKKAKKLKISKESKKNDFTEKPPIVHHKIRCCCLSFKWPPWGYEPCPSPTPIFYKQSDFEKMPQSVNLYNSRPLHHSSRQRYSTEVSSSPYNSPRSHSLHLNSARVPYNYAFQANFKTEKENLLNYNGSKVENERFTMTEFAVRFFRRPKHLNGTDTFSLQRKKKEWTWKEITDKVKFTDHPINHSLLRLENTEADKLAVDAFLSIMRYMGDENLKRSQTLADCVYEILSLCHRFIPLRDEVYCQIIKQLTANRSTRRSSEESQVRGWRLLTIFTAYFSCTETLKPYLVKYLSDIANDERRVFHGTAKQCLYHLAQSFHYGGRRFILSAVEVEAITSGKNVRRQVYYYPGGYRKIIYTRAVTVAEQIVQELCLEMNIRSLEEQQEFSLGCIIEKDNVLKTLNNDEYILDVITEHEALNNATNTNECVFILSRTVWIHLLRLDNQLYTNALFFQIMPNYIAGLLTFLCNGNVTAATLSDVARLGALLLLSDSENNNINNISPNFIGNLVPKTILRYSNLSLDQWLKRIQKEVENLTNNLDERYTAERARQEFLEIVSKWNLYGASFFFVKRAITKRQNIGECVVAINKHGVRVLTNETHELLLHYSLIEIDAINKYTITGSQFLELRFTTVAAQKYGYDVFTVETESNTEIARVVGQYLYLNHGFSSENEPIFILNEDKEDKLQK